MSTFSTFQDFQLDNVNISTFQDSFCTNVLSFNYFPYRRSLTCNPNLNKIISFIVLLSLNILLQHATRYLCNKQEDHVDGQPT